LKTIGITISALSLLLTAVAFAQSSGGDYLLVSSTIDGGGGVSSGGDFVLTGTIGQFDADPNVASGGNFKLAGGFWSNAEINEMIFKDGFEVQ